ncbi:MAG: LysR family transcriptional regulator [Comamonadaceae bacterium]|nr:MAG: LysR family transcriptional regulator [Comamonadaceae bacterium]
MADNNSTNAALLEPKLLRLLELLYSTRSVTRAAELLGQSQPTVSIWLAKLREQLADPLFVRTAEGMLPTPRTESLIGGVREVLEGLRRLSESPVPFDPATAQRRFVICMTDASHITLLPELLAHVRALGPGLSLSASRIDGHLEEALQSGAADLALGFLPWLDTGFYQQTLYAQDWICLANPRHPRITDATPEQWNLAVYQSESHIGITPGTSYQLLDHTVAALRLKRQIRLELPGFLGLSAILSSSDLVATLPRQIGETLARQAGLRTLPCPFEVQGFAVKQYWHARFHHDNANRWLRGVCANLFIHKP